MKWFTHDNKDMVNKHGFSFFEYLVIEIFENV